MFEKRRNWVPEKKMFCIEDCRAPGAKGHLPTMLFEWLMTQRDQTASVAKCARVMRVSEWEIRAWAASDVRLWHEEFKSGEFIAADTE